MNTPWFHDGSIGWTLPASSVARTSSSCSPVSAFQSKDQARHADRDPRRGSDGNASDRPAAVDAHLDARDVPQPDHAPRRDGTDRRRGTAAEPGSR